MFNDWFKIGPVTVHGYGFMIAVWHFVCVLVIRTSSKKTRTRI